MSRRKRSEPGNIDLYARPPVRNPDGSQSTVRSMSFDEDGREVLVPTVVGDRVVSNKEAIAEYRKSGKHLGKYTSVKRANRAGARLHKDYEAGKYPAKSIVSGREEQASPRKKRGGSRP